MRYIVYIQINDNYKKNGDKFLMQLTKKQEEAIHGAEQWWHSPQRFTKPYTIAGAAGTGKSSVVQYIIDALNINPDRLAMVAFTGAAAINLSKKSGYFATTIHRLSYYPYTDEETKEIKFAKKPIEEVQHMYDLFIVDELGTVSDYLMNDLIHFQVPILALGDPNQLPPVMGHMNEYMLKPDITFDQVMRQSLDNPIVRLSNDILTKNAWISPQNFREYEGEDESGVYVYQRNNLPMSVYKDADQILAPKNKTVKYINDTYRKYILGIDIDKNIYPLKGEKVVILHNFWKDGMVLGENKFQQFPVNGLVGSMNGYYDIKDVYGSAHHMDNYNKQYGPMHNPEVIGDITLLEESKDLMYDLVNIKLKDFPEATFDMFVDKIAFLVNPKVAADLITSRDPSLIELEENRRRLFKKNTGQVNYNMINFAYAMTVYKSQGTDWPTVTYYDEKVNNSGKLLKQQRYTAVTRAKNRLNIVL